jgi:hypothetical protein
MLYADKPADDIVLTEQQQKQVGKVELAEDALKASEKSKIKTQDYIVDLETADIALKIVSWQHTDNSKRVIAAVPFAVRTDSEASKVWYQLSANEPVDMNRELASKIYADFGQDIYWSTYLSGLEGENQKGFDPQKFLLTTMASLKGTEVKDIEDRNYGKVVDLAINASTGDIVYCVVKNDKDGSLRAIPLGALVGRDLSHGWKIELASDAISKFEAFDRSNPPQFVDRGWEEYVSVRYGRRGLQEDAKK